jgi:ferritin-like metal-binding protein YciE
MQITNFRDMYIAELQELRSAEMQLTETWRRAAEVAANPRLTNIFVKHGEQTQLQKERLDQLLQHHRADPKAHTDQAMQALVHETEKMMATVEGNDLRDAALIASAQKLAHYEIAAFGTAAALADQLGLRDDQKVLDTCLNEEKRADANLTDIAKREVNQDAVAV